MSCENKHPYLVSPSPECDTIVIRTLAQLFDEYSYEVPDAWFMLLHVVKLKLTTIPHPKICVVCQFN